MKNRLLAIFLSIALGGCNDPSNSSRQDLSTGGAVPLQPGQTGEATVESGAGSQQPERSATAEKTENRIAFFPPSNPAAEPAVPMPRLGEEVAGEEPKTEVMPPSSSELRPEANTAASTPGQRRTREEALKIVGEIKPQLQVAHTQDGEPVLQIQYPWYELPRPSVQIGWFEESADPASAEPLPIDGTIAEEIWQKQVDRLNKPTYPSSVELVKTSVTFIDRGNGELITLRGRENLLGKEAAYAVQEQTGTPVVIYLLDRWADPQGVLCFAQGDFDLTAKLQNPGKLRVWLLSEEQTVWSETVSWPGGKAAVPVAEQPAPSPEEKQPEMPLAQPEAAPGPSFSADPGLPSQPGVTDSGQPAPPQPPTTPESPGSAVQPAPETKTAETKTSDEPTPPSGWKPSESKSTEPEGEPRPPAAQPSQTAPAGEPNYESMSIDELARHIEKRFGPTMSTEVRRFWLNGWRYYFVVQNPPDVRRKIFMDMLKLVWDEKPPEELRKALKVLYQKLQNEQPKGLR